MRDVITKLPFHLYVPRIVCYVDDRRMLQTLNGRPMHANIIHRLLKKKVLGQTVSCRLLTMAAHFGFLVDKLALELLSLLVLRFFAVTIISPKLQFIIIHYQCHIGQRASLNKTTYKLIKNCAEK